MRASGASTVDPVQDVALLDAGKPCHLVIEVREATSADSAAISTLIGSLAHYRSSNLSEPAPEAFKAGFSREAIDRYLLDSRHAYLIASVEGVLAGVIGVRDRNVVQHLFVAERWQRRGIARRLWDVACERRIVDFDSGPVTVRSSIYAVPIYERFGFHASAPMVRERGVMYVPMGLLPSRRSGLRAAARGPALVEKYARAVAVRRASEAEHAILEALQRRASLMNVAYRESLLANPDAMTIPVEQVRSGQVLLAERSGSIVGFAVLLPRHDGNAEIDGLFVEPDHWRTGIGRVLIDHCVLSAKGRGAKALHVVGNPYAEGFYRVCGFEQIGVEATQFGDGLLLVKQIE